MLINSIEIIRIAGIVTGVLIVVLTYGFMLTRYKKCPADKIMVIYGKVGNNPDGSARNCICIHGGAKFIWPLIQSYKYLDLNPISIFIDLKNALTRDNNRIDIPSRFTVGISTQAGVMQNAAERLLGLRHDEIEMLARDIILGQMRFVAVMMDTDGINLDRDIFLDTVSRNVECELKKIGLRLINVNITDVVIHDNKK